MLAELLLALTLARPEPVAWPADGKALYREHCAGCHGADGSGDGPLAKELRFKPRAFKEGKFAFGNTPEAMGKTVRSGIPDAQGFRMPAFAAVLKDDEVAAVVEFARSLIPAEALATGATAAEMELVVGAEAKVVRGIFPPLREGAPVQTRGLLVGLPGGASFQYATDPLHLVAIRRGGFVARTDWLERGGKPLTPLGEAVWVAPELESDAVQWIPFALAELPVGDTPPAFAFARTKLRETTVRGDQVELKADLLDASGRLRAHVIERPRGLTVSGGFGVVQEFEFFASDEPLVVLASLAVASDPRRTLLPPSAPADGAGVPARPLLPPLRHAAEQQLLLEATGWFVVPLPDAGFVCVRHFGALVDASRFNGPTHDCRDLAVRLLDEPVALRRVAVVRDEVSEAALRQMTREVEAALEGGR